MLREAYLDGYKLGLKERENALRVEVRDLKAHKRQIDADFERAQRLITEQTQIVNNLKWERQSLEGWVRALEGRGGTIEVDPIPANRRPGYDNTGS
jgi:hypothetical protein